MQPVQRPLCPRMLLLALLLQVLAMQALATFSQSCQMSLTMRCCVGDGGEKPTAAKANAKANPKKKGKNAAAKENPKAVWDVRKAKVSLLDKQAFPVVDRGATKDCLQTVVLAKASQLACFCGGMLVGTHVYMHLFQAGTFAKIHVQLAGHAASVKAVDELTTAKEDLELKWKEPAAFL